MIRRFAITLVSRPSPSIEPMTLVCISDHFTTQPPRQVKVWPGNRTDTLQSWNLPPRASHNCDTQVGLGELCGMVASKVSCSSIIMIARIHFTIHTAGINSFSMYRYLTQPVGGIPRTHAETRYQSLSFIQNLIRTISLPSKSAEIE